MQQPDMDVSPIVVDVETVGLVNAADYLEPIPDAALNDSPVEASKRLVDPAKIAADIEQKLAAQAEQNAAAVAKVEHQRAARMDKLGLDWNVGRIVAIGWWTETVSHCSTLQTEDVERTALQLFWREARRRTIVTFNGRGFDLPYLIQRSRYLGIAHPTLDLRPYGGGQGNVDLYLELTFGRKESPCMRQTLKAFCRRFGIPVDDEIAGKDIPALIAAGRWEEVAAHCSSDIALTVALARRLGVIAQPKPAPETAAVA